MGQRTGLFRTYGKKIVLCDDKSQNVNDKLGAIGDISFVIKKAAIKDDLLVVAGDNLFEINFTDFIKYFKKHGTTICLKDFKGSSRDIISQYGLVTLDDDKKIIDFEEKPPQPQSTLVAMCLYIFAKGDLKLINEYLKKGFNPDAPGYYLQWLYKQKDIYGYTLKGRWFDIGDIDSYEKASDYYRHKYLGETAKSRLY
jgi:glucose-1-phosphate thymidylyltransferase